MEANDGVLGVKKGEGGVDGWWLGVGWLVSCLVCYWCVSSLSLLALSFSTPRVGCLAFLLGAAHFHFFGFSYHFMSHSSIIYSPLFLIYFLCFFLWRIENVVAG